MYLQYFPASSTNTASNRLIDPRLQAPEDDTDISDIEASTKAKRRGLKPATKVAGVRQTDKKGKKRAHYSDSDIDSDAAPAPKHRGHPKGSSNFSEEDITKLLSLQEVVPPWHAAGMVRPCKIPGLGPSHILQKRWLVSVPPPDIHIWL
jgi:hypothetical protein